MTLVLALFLQAEPFEGLFRQERGAVWTYRDGEKTVRWTLLRKEKGRLTFDEKEGDDPRAVTVVLAIADGYLALERKVDQEAASRVRLLKLDSKEGDAWEGGRRLADQGKTIRVRVGEEEVSLSAEEGITKRGALALAGVERPAFVPIHLGGRYNAELTRPWHPGNLPEGGFNDLGALPRGVQSLDGVSFDLRGVLQLASVMAPNFPRTAEGLEVRTEAARLHFLHATGWVAPPGAPVGSFRVRLKDGTVHEVPLIFGEDVSDWWQYPQMRFKGTRAKVAWVGSNPACRQQRAVLKLYRIVWENPTPAVEIESVDYQSSMTAAAPFLVAMTAEKK